MIAVIFAAKLQAHLSAAEKLNIHLQCDGHIEDFRSRIKHPFSQEILIGDGWFDGRQVSDRSRYALTLAQEYDSGSGSN